MVAALGRLTGPGFLSQRLNDEAVSGVVSGLGAAFWSPPSLRKGGRASGPLALGGLALIAVFDLGARVFDEADLVLLSAVSGAIIVLLYTGWLVYEELVSTGSIRQDLEDEHDIVSAPELEHEIEQRLSRLTAQAGCATPAVEIGASRLPRAATVGYRPRNSVILVSRGMVDSLDDDELDAVLAHELAHLLNRDAAVLTALSFPLSKMRGLMSIFLNRSAEGSLAIVPLLLLALPFYVINRLVVPTVTRHREYVADDAAAELIGSPAAMASALSTLDREHAIRSSTDFRVQWSTAAFGIVPPPWRERHVLDGAIRFFYRRLLGTHPRTEKRIERLRSQIGRRAL